MLNKAGTYDERNPPPPESLATYAAYDSIFNKLLTLPDETLVYPGHDYKPATVPPSACCSYHRLSAQAAAQTRLSSPLQSGSPTLAISRCAQRFQKVCQIRSRTRHEMA